jgi:choline dehydrogenase-like flavoprotein
VVQALVVGSGAGGAVTALELASRGVDTVVLEEGSRHTLDEYGASTPTGMQRLYRNRGMTPILGSVPLGYVEGACLGGSTEINSGFWHRTPREVLLRWRAQFGVEAISAEELAPHFAWAEDKLKVSKHPRAWPASTQVFARGIEAMGWAAQEVPRAAADCKETNTCAQGCPTGAKQGMSRNILPLAEQAGACVLTDCRVELILTKGKRAIGVLARTRSRDGKEELVRLDAENIFVCAGPTETPSLLRRSGVKLNVGETLRVHPMLKVAARFPDRLDAHLSVLPLLQVKEFWPEVSLGGAFFTAGHLAMTLSDNWPTTEREMKHSREMALYYVAVRGTGRGYVRPSALGSGSSVFGYELSEEDLRNLSRGLARLSTLLLAAGAEAVFPSVQGLPAIRTEIEGIRWLDEALPRNRLSLTTVHAFSSCPMGENLDRCAVDSFGRVRRFENLYVNDASMLPDSPGVNPQGSIMAVARRNAIHFAEGLS